MTDQPMTWLAIVLAVALGGGIVLFVWAMGAPGRRRPDREPESEKVPPRSARVHDDRREAVTPGNPRHSIERDGVEKELLPPELRPSEGTGSVNPNNDPTQTGKT